MLCDSLEDLYRTVEVWSQHPRRRFVEVGCGDSKAPCQLRVKTSGAVQLVVQSLLNPELYSPKSVETLLETRYWVEQKRELLRGIYAHCRRLTYLNSSALDDAAGAAHELLDRLETLRQRLCTHNPLEPRPTPLHPRFRPFAQQIEAQVQAHVQAHFVDWSLCGAAPAYTVDRPLLSQVFTWLDAGSLRCCALVNRQWRSVVADALLDRVQGRVFGARQWKDTLGDPGPVPPAPPQALVRLSRQEEQRSVLFWVPEKLDGVSCNVERLAEHMELSSEVLAKARQLRIRESGWTLIDRQVMNDANGSTREISTIVLAYLAIAYRKWSGEDLLPAGTQLSSFSPGAPYWGVLCFQANGRLRHYIYRPDRGRVYSVGGTASWYRPSNRVRFLKFETSL